MQSMLFTLNLMSVDLILSSDCCMNLLRFCLDPKLFAKYCQFHHGYASKEYFSKKDKFMQHVIYM